MSGNSGRGISGDPENLHRGPEKPTGSSRKRHGRDSTLTTESNNETAESLPKQRKLLRSPHHSLSASVITTPAPNTSSFEAKSDSGPLTRSRTRNSEFKQQPQATPSRSTKTKKTSKRHNSDVLGNILLSRSVTPDPSSSNLTIAGSEVSTTLIPPSFASDSSQPNSAQFEFTDIIGSAEGFSQSVGINMSAPGRDNESASDNTTPFISRSQHVQRASAFFGSLMPRMQHLLGGTHSSQVVTHSHSVTSTEYMPHMRILSLMEELRSENEIRQSEACSELSEILLLGNEESLPNFPIRDLTLCLVALLNKDHNFELMLSASRCITNLQEALPRSHTAIVEAIPVLLQKLKHIEYIDVAEQTLMILEVISRRNAKNILAAAGVQAVISHVDFFSLPSQRLAFQIVANCASHVTSAEFHMIQDCLTDLTQRLSVEDKRCVESVCVFFNRLIENLRFHPSRLRQIAGKNYELLQMFQQLLIAHPTMISSNTFICLVKSLRHMFANCSDLAVAFFRFDSIPTIRQLLMGSEKKSDDGGTENTVRPSQQLREIVDLIGELLPQVPAEGIFEINQYLTQYTNPTLFAQNARARVTNFHWVYKCSGKDRSSKWRAFAVNDQLTLERNFSIGVSVVPLEMDGQLCEINFATMVKRVISTGIETKIERRPYSDRCDERQKLKEENAVELFAFVSNLFPILVDIGSNSTCTNLRYDCMRVALRMVVAVTMEEQLLTFLNDVPLAAYISTTLSSSKNLALVAIAIQFVDVLSRKIPNLYMPLFESEGVFYELKFRAESLPIPKNVADKCPNRAKSAPSTSEPGEAASQVDMPAVSAIGRLLASHQQLHSTMGNSMSAVPVQMPTNIVVSSGSSEVSNALMSHYTTSALNLGSALQARPILPNLFLSTPNIQTTNAVYQTLNTVVSSGYVYGLSYPPNMDSSSFNFSNPSSFKAAALEKLEEFVRSNALRLCTSYDVSQGNSESVSNLKSLSEISEQFLDPDCGIETINKLCDILNTRDLSAFQINYSGLISALIQYFTQDDGKRIERLRQFASVFMVINDNNKPQGGIELYSSFTRLVSRILLAVERLEQFNVRVTNLSGSITTMPQSYTSSTVSSGQHAGNHSTMYLRGAQALRFFQSHQIRCNLRRHPTCKILREWRRGRGSIKVDPFTSISAIERYLVDRGIGITNREDESSENDDISDDEKDASEQNISMFKGRIEIFIGENKLPSDMTILQAIRQFALTQDDEDQETIPPSIWVAGHTLYFRAFVDDPAPCTSKASPTYVPNNTDIVVSPMRKSSLRSQRSSKKPKMRASERRDEKKAKSLFVDGTIPAAPWPLERYLRSSLDYSVEDPSEQGLVLLRILYGLNNFWWCLYEDSDVPPATHAPILPQSCFYSAKLNSKIVRQLSDFLTVATQQIPKWTKSLVRSVPFIFPFVTRRNFLYCTAFGRDRALMHLVNEANPDDHDSESTSRLVPRLERRKISVNRSSLLKDAQHALTQVSSTKALLEIVFDGEVGTGFGPTLEFYSTISREVQKHSLRLWHGTAISSVEEISVEYTTNETGLYPAICRHSGSQKISDSKQKRFEFIGRLLAQTLLDSRILDIPLAPVFFKWLLGEKDTIGLMDLECLEPTIYNSLRHIAKMNESEIADLEMSFTYPGNGNFELVKGGKHQLLNRDNYKQFVDLICYWRLVEGVRYEMDAVCRGFHQIINVEHLSIFESNEMEELFCGNSENVDDMWCHSALQKSIRPDHGYTHDSVQIAWLLEMLATFDKEKRRKFLQFVTGSPRLPVGGFRALHPPLTVVRKIASCGSPSAELPSAMTCYNYLKIPPYENFEIFKERFDVALQYIYSFHLT